MKREEIDQDDLPEMEQFFRIFIGSRSASKAMLEPASKRCKIQDIAMSRDSHHWVIDRWWTKDERVAAGIDEAPRLLSKTDIDSALAKFISALDDYEKLRAQVTAAAGDVVERSLGDTAIFRLFIGERFLKKEIAGSTCKIPIYSANVFTPMGFTDTLGDMEFSKHSILWGIDGNFELRHVAPNDSFVPTDHCGVLQILSDDVVPEYLLYAITVRREEENFDRSFRASLSNMRRFKVTIPVTKSGEFDVAKQQEIAAYFTELRRRKEHLERLKTGLDGTFKHYIL